MSPHFKCMHQQLAVFKKHVRVLSRVKSARGYFPVVGIGAFDGLAQPSTDRNPAKSRGKSKKGKRKGKSSSQKGGKPTNLGTPGILQNHRPHVPSLVVRCPRSVRLRLAQLVVDHITLLVFVLTSACCQTDCFVTWKTCIWYLCSGLCSVRAPCYGATVEETEQDQDENDIKDFVTFSIKSLEGFAILDGGATKTVSGFISIQPVADQYEDTTIETTKCWLYVSWRRNGGGKHENLYITR